MEGDYWLVTADCKSVPKKRSWFNSKSIHHLLLMIRLKTKRIYLSSTFYFSLISQSVAQFGRALALEA